MAEIRWISLGDEHKLSGIGEEIWEADIWEQPSREDYENKLIQIENREVIFLIVEEENEVIGYIFSYPYDERQKPYPETDRFWDEMSGEVLYIDELGVVPEYRKEGLGSKLLEETITEAEELGFDKLLLRTNPEAGGVMKLYNRHGFKDLEVDDPEHPERTYMLKSLV